MADENVPMRSGEPSLVTVGVLVGLAYLGYEYVYKPYAIQQEYQRQLLLYQLQHGGTQQDAIAAIGNIACQAAAAYFSGGKSLLFKPTGSLCALAGSLSEKVLKFGVKLVPREAGIVGRGVASLAVSAERGTVSTAKGAVSGVARGGRAVVHAFTSCFGLC